jgi:hypothetical protein
MILRTFAVLISLCILSLNSKAQSPDSLMRDSIASDQLKVFINCQWCYKDFLRTEITWVNFVQDRFDAQVDLLISNINTGSGGTNFGIQFIGQKEFIGMIDTLNYTSSAISTDDEMRRALAQKIKLGLIRYVAKTDMANNVDIKSNLSEDNEASGIGSNPKNDPWKAWIFRVGANTEISGQKVNKSIDINTNLSANKTTEDFKFSFMITTGYSEQKFDFDGEKSRYVNRRQMARAQLVKSLGNKVSIGGRLTAERSDFSNYDLKTNGFFAVEYDFYPYKEAQTKIITASYLVGMSSLNYQDTTIYGLTKEYKPSHGLNLGASFTQQWGNLSGGIFSNQYLDDLDKYGYGIYLNFDVRLFRGLTMSSYFNFSVVHDQINLRANGASSEQILLQQRELATDYNFYIWYSISYRFGSIYNNVVNPRFDYSIGN